MSDPAHPSQNVWYLRADGTRSRSRDEALYVDEGEIILRARRSTTVLPPGLLLGIAENESGSGGDDPRGCKYNEIDEDLDDNGNVAGTTYGLCQMNRSEALKALKFGAAIDPDKLCDPDTNLLVAAAIFQDYAKTLAAAADVDVEGAPFDLWAFVAIAHNVGMGVDHNATSGKKRALAMVQDYGLSWSTVRSATPYGLVTLFNTRLGPYVDRVLARCSKYPLVVPGGSSSGGSSGDDDGGSSDSGTPDDPAAVATPFGGLDPYTVRKVIAGAIVALALYAAYLSWRARR